MYIGSIHKPCALQYINTITDTNRLYTVMLLQSRAIELRTIQDRSVTDEQ